MKQIYQSFVKEISALGCVPEYITDHVEFSYQGFRFHVVLEDEETDLLRISANILSTNQNISEWISILYEDEGTMDYPTYVYDIRIEDGKFQLDVAISFLFLFSPEIHDKALYLEKYVMAEIKAKIDLLTIAFRHSYDELFSMDSMCKGERDDLLRKDFIPTYYKEAVERQETFKKKHSVKDRIKAVPEDIRRIVKFFTILVGVLVPIILFCLFLAKM